jgi:CheY-like chemotaxis protein
MKKPFILIAEDDIDGRMLLQTAFEEIKHEGILNFLRDGGDVLRFLQKQSKNCSDQPGLILLDLNKPRKDGWRVLKDIKTNDELKKIPVIIFPTNRSEAVIQKCYEWRANSYISKPIN